MRISISGRENQRGKKWRISLHLGTAVTNVTSERLEHDHLPVLTLYISTCICRSCLGNSIVSYSIVEYIRVGSSLLYLIYPFNYSELITISIRSPYLARRTVGVSSSLPEAET